MRKPALVVAVALGAALAVVGFAVGQTQAPAAPDSARATRVKADVRAILSSPDYKADTGGPSAPERLGRAIGDAISRFFRALGRLFGGRQMPNVPTSPILPQIISALFIALMVIGIAWGVVKLVHLIASREPGKGKRGKPDVSEEPEEDPEPETAQVDTWLEAARRHAAAGDFRRAYRSVFLAALLRLDRAGAIRFQRSRTNGEYLRALRPNQPLHDGLRPAARDFDVHWYGGVPIAEADYLRMTEQYQRLVSRLPVS